MRIGLWNIDHPEAASGSERNDARYQGVLDYLLKEECDVYIITEANAAMHLNGYTCELSEHSPFISSRRFYGEPNRYHQVAIYSKLPMARIEVDEPINGLRVEIQDGDQSIGLYGNVITLKDQWSKTSKLTYSDRLEQQIQAMQSLPQKSMLIAGDFNLRLGWPQKLPAHRRIKKEVMGEGWQWPTKERDDSVQHVLHSPDLNPHLEFDFSVKYTEGRKSGLSDHPYVGITV